MASAAPARQHECVPECAQASGPRQLDLPTGVTLAPQRGQDRHAEVQREVVRLIEPSPPPPQCMQRHRNGDVGASQPLAGGAPHQACKRSSQRPSPFVLERVNDLAQRAGVHAGRPARRQWATRPVAIGAQHARDGVGPGDPHATEFADRCRDTRYPAPAGRTDDPPRGRLQRTLAGGAARRPDDGQDCVECLGKGRERHPERFRKPAIRRRVGPPRRRWGSRYASRCPRGAPGRRAPGCRA